MIDNVKLHISGDNAKKIFHNELLNFSIKTNIKTGEVLTIKTCNKSGTYEYETLTYLASFKEVLTFTYKETCSTNLKAKNQTYSTNLDINGSFHKLYNHGRNDNDYAFIDFTNTVHYLSETFGFNPTCFKVQNLEFAVNIMLPINAREFISNVVYYKNKRPDINTFGGTGYMKQFEFTQYFIKIYDKGLQNNTVTNQLRFEIKAIKNQYLKFANIRYLSDLLDSRNWQKLAKRLHDVFLELLITEYCKKDEMKLNDRILLINAKNSDFWHKTHKRSIYSFKEKRVKFRLLKDIYGNGLQRDVAQLIQDKTILLNNANNNIESFNQKSLETWLKLPPVFTNIKSVHL